MIAPVAAPDTLKPTVRVFVALLNAAESMVVVIELEYFVIAASL